jgi:hypothetical protein
MTEDKPDFTADQLYEIATLPQREMVEKMLPFGWEISHLWKRDEGDICVWLIARTPGGRGYTHGYIEPSGKLLRYQPVIKIRREQDEADS